MPEGTVQRCTTSTLAILGSMKNRRIVPRPLWAAQPWTHYNDDISRLPRFFWEKERESPRTGVTKLRAYGAINGCGR
jgi:hypothetical protein